MDRPRSSGEASTRDAPAPNDGASETTPARGSIRVRDLRFDYPRGQYRLSVPRLDVESGERVALVGASGSGKTTLLHLLAGILRPDSGSIEVADVRVDEASEALRRRFRLRDCGMIFQEFELLEHLSVRDNALLPYLVEPTLGLDARVRTRAAELLRRAGLEALARRRPGRLSQGERQRVGICRALITGPSLILADEPTGNLDPETTREILVAIFEEVERARATLLFVTHDHSLLDRFDRVLHLSDLVAPLPGGGR